MSQRAVSLLVALMVLAACTQAPERAAEVPQRQSSGAPVAKSTSRNPVKPPAELKDVRPQPRPAADKDLATLPPASAPPTKLVGLSEDEMVELLGRPAEESALPPGKEWVYRASGCRLLVHLFPDMEKGGFYALDYTVAEGGHEACLGKVAGEARHSG